MHQICGAPILIQMEIPLSIALYDMGVKCAKKSWELVGMVNLHKQLSNFEKIDQPYWAQDVFHEILYPRE